VQLSKRRRLAYLYLLRNRVQDRAAASGAHLLKGSLMHEQDEGIDLDWRINCSLLVTRWWMHSDNPGEDFSHWLDEAGEADEPYMRYAIRAFELTSHLNYIELEEREAMLLRWKSRRAAQGSA
jgi:hypothetical protein